MSKLSFKKIALVASLLCLPATASFASVLNVGVGQEKNFSVSCKSGNFVGVVEGVVGRHYYTGKYVHTKRYKITRLNGQSGGNKANINLTSGQAPAATRSNTVNSPDSMIQDGKWHDLRLTRSNMGVGNSRAEVYYQFIFDKSGTDPKCWSSSVYF